MLDRLIRLVGWTQEKSYKSLEVVLSVPPEDWIHTLLESGIENYVIVSTCNRLEIYYSSEIEVPIGFNEENAIRLSGTDAVNHLFRVTAGLESMSVGENEILHQVKAAFDQAVKGKHAHDPLAAIFRKAISSGKLVRRDTKISRGKVSLPALSVDILNKKYGVKGKNIAVIGTGKMASDILKYIEKLEPAGMTILGRSSENASSMAESFGASWGTIADLVHSINENDIIVTATSSKALLVRRDMVSTAIGKKVFLDISNPRNVESPRDGDFYDLIDLPYLTPILEMNRANKVDEITSAEKIVRTQAENLINRLSKLEVETLIAGLYKHADELKKQEISRLKRALASGTDFDEALEAMSSALVKKLLASQTEVLRNVHGSKVTADIREAIESAYFGDNSKTSSKKSRDRRGTRNQPDRTPPLSQKL